MEQDKITVLMLKALERVKEINADVTYIKDEFDADEEGYYHLKWEYPGAWYRQPVNCQTDDEFIDFIVRETLRAWK